MGSAVAWAAVMEAAVATAAAAGSAAVGSAAGEPVVAVGTCRHTVLCQGDPQNVHAGGFSRPARPEHVWRGQ